MTLNTIGFDGTVSEAQWSKLMRYAGEISYKHGVASGFDVTPGASTREVTVSAGVAMLPGLLVESDGPVTLTVDPNTGTAPRTDYLVLRGDWATNTVTLAVVKGSATTPPALGQSEGVAWELPLARIKVRPAVATILTSDITICKPLPRTTAIVYKPAVGAASIGPSHAPQVIATASVIDPGWPYRVRILGGISFSSANSGYGRIIVSAAGSVLVRGQSGALAAGGATAQVLGVSDVLTGPTTVTMAVVAFLMGNGDGPLQTGEQTGLHFFHVEVVPA